MIDASLDTQNRLQHTRRTLFISNVLQEPFIALNLLLDVMLSSHFAASALQISVLTTLRPVVAVFAFYWGSILLFKPNLLRFSLVGATALAALLFCFAPCADSIWYFIVAEACFVLFWRAAKPSQIEILKLNVDTGVRELLFSKALSLSRASGMLIGPVLGLFLRYYPDLWRELFAAMAILYAGSSYLKSKFYVPKLTNPVEKMPISMRELLIKPWQDSWRLLKKNSAFLHFQIGFFIAGSGIMFAKPSIPSYLASKQLSLFEIFSLFTILEGLGFILTSTWWARYLQKMGLHAASCLVAICFALQPFLLIFPVDTPFFIFLAYFFYGAAQAGSSLVWNLSGLILCGNESSSQYTSVNILAIGIRGCIIPVLGGICTHMFGPQVALFVSFICMITGAGYLLHTSKRAVATA